MGLPAVGSVVLVDFPYSNYSQLKKRPVLVIGLADFNNLIVCQVTSKYFPSRSAILLGPDDFKSGELKKDSYIRPDKIYTVEPRIVTQPLAIIKNSKMAEVREKLTQIFKLS